MLVLEHRLRQKMTACRQSNKSGGGDVSAERLSIVLVAGDGCWGWRDAGLCLPEDLKLGSAEVYTGVCIGELEWMLSNEKPLGVRPNLQM